MTRRSQLLHIILFVAALVSLNWTISNSLLPPTGDASIWYHAGLLMLILGMYWIEPYFTKPADVVVNGLVVFISISSLSNPPNAEWWSILRYFSLCCITLAFFVVWAGSPAIAGNDTSIFKRVAYLLVVRLGSATVLFSAVFLLALFSYFEQSSKFSKYIMCFWVILLVAKHIDLEGMVRSLVSVIKKPLRQPVGRLSRFAQPNVARFEVLPGNECPRGSLVAFTSAVNSHESDIIAVVVSHRATPSRIEAEAILLDKQFAEGALDNRKIVIKIDPADKEICALLECTPIGKDFKAIIGFAFRESNIAHLRFELCQSTDVEEGNLVGVNSLNGSLILYQIVDGVLHEEASLENGERSFIVGEAQQLGTWDPERQGFSSHSWVVPENAPVILNIGSDIVAKVEKPGLVDIGNVPNSNYPIKINVPDLVLYHSAILGVTGSGKSFLAYSLIEKCADEGIKVLCLDLTGDYQRYLRGAVRIATPSVIDPFLNDTVYKIGIVEFSEAGVHPILATNKIAQRALDWCRKSRKDEEVSDPKPKVLLILEEAHSLIPEWNSSPTPNLRDTVNSTAQIALQARKYGLGFMVITQRTANVTKSILNQCNTIFAFQAYDETGFEFMKNYMGFHYVHALPNLKQRHGVVVGKASASDRPVIVRFYDQPRKAVAAQLPPYDPEKDEPTGDKSEIKEQPVNSADAKSRVAD